MPGASSETGSVDIIRIGESEIHLSTGELVREGRIVLLGRRALKLLTVLHDARGAMVSNEELLRLVWSGAIVEQNTLQSHISSLRRALGDDRNRLKTFSGRGYKLHLDSEPAEPFEAPAGAAEPAAEAPAEAAAPNTLPSSASSLIGRDAVVEELLLVLSRERVLTLTGAGGIGKTRLALEVGWRASAQFPGGTFFVDLASISSPSDVAPTVMSSIGSSHDFHASVEDRVRALGQRPVLIVIDNCEHVVTVAADVIEAMARANPALRILATSREPLRVDGECVYPVGPLELPPAATASPEDLLAYGATKLFIGRSMPATAQLSSDSAVAALIVDICTRLDGNPLAIELAAARADSIGIDEVARRLDDSLTILVNGKRTALPRHQTLRATLAWSYGLLGVEERAVFRRLAIFAGGFTLDSACAVASDSDLPEAAVLDCVSNLVSKSLLTTYVDWSKRRYRFLETTRAYAQERLLQSGEHERVARAHARHYTVLLDTAKVRANVTVAEFARTIFLPEFDNARAAMNWAFSEFGDPALGFSLTSSVTPAMYEMLLLEECAAAASRALDSLGGKPALDRAMELRIHTSLAASLVYLRGPTPATIATWEDVLALSYELDDAPFQVRALWGLWTCSLYSGAPLSAMENARAYGRVAQALPPNHNVAKYTDRLVGISHHYLGNHIAAREHLDAFISLYDHGRHFVPLGNFIDHSALARATLSRVLWFLGQFDRARAMAKQAVAEALAEENALAICYVIVEGALPVSMLLEEFGAARGYLSLLHSASERHGSNFWKLLGRCHEVLLESTEDVSVDAPMRLRAAIEDLHAQAYDTYAIDLRNRLAHLLHRLDRTDEALALIQRCLERTAESSEGLWEPELLRSRAEFAKASSRPPPFDDLVSDLREAIERARAQGSLALELRASTQLAALLLERGERAPARRTLLAAYEQCDAAQQSPDLERARSLLEQLG